MYRNRPIFLTLLIIFLGYIPGTVSAEAKIGLVNLDALFKEIPIYRESQAKIKKEFDPRARKLKNLENEWNSLNEKYLKNEKIMANDEKKELVQKIRTTEEKFRSNQQSLQKDLQEKQQEELRKIRQIVESAITDYAEDNNFDLIIRADGTALYAKKYLDVTQDIISELQ